MVQEIQDLMLQEMERMIRGRQAYKDLRMLIGGRLVRNYLLRKLKDEDDNSRLACFGYHVIAIKR